ncbi:anti-sigma B factor antagonist [Motilibacter peucedani]|uniref:Anti-sigma factor antagonist n=1 Tax=Motilibacter peucedani TaxID=598650 RepID=A0A420XP58_9ACTN|nr:STAS domain-containing protein [Motilibacter peucedani]RKS73977.1 anti-sigma B factor antagonist [Motilibacter peucedani]
MSEEPPPELSVERRDEGTWTVLSVKGEIDAHTGPALRTALHDAVDAGRHRLVLDFTDVSFLDSSALGVLVSAHKRLLPEGGEIRIVSDRPVVLTLFELTALDQVFTLVPTLEQALAD